MRGRPEQLRRGVYFVHPFSDRCFSGGGLILATSRIVKVEQGFLLTTTPSSLDFESFFLLSVFGVVLLEGPPLIDFEAASFYVVIVRDDAFRVYQLVLPLKIRGWLFWSVHRIQNYHKKLVDHLGHNFFGPFVGLSQERVRVDLDQPDPKVFIYHKIVAQEFKRIFSEPCIHFVLRCGKSVYNYVFHSWNKVPLDVDLVLIFVQIFLKLLIIESISCFVAPIRSFVLNL